MGLRGLARFLLVLGPVQVDRWISRHLLRCVVGVIFHLSFHVIRIVVHNVHALVMALIIHVLVLFLSLCALQVSKILLMSCLWILEATSIVHADRLLVGVADRSTLLALDDEVGVD